MDTLESINDAFEECDEDETCDLSKIQTHLEDKGFSTNFFNRVRL